MSVNIIHLVGHLGKDAEKRYLPDGTAVVSFSLATSEKWHDKAGKRQERTDWHRVEFFGKAAEAVYEYLVKGKEIYLHGSVRYEEWEDRKGEKRWSTKVRAQRVQLLGSARGRREAEPEPTGAEPVSDADESVPF